MRFLASHGADVNAVNELGDSAGIGQPGSVIANWNCHDTAGYFSKDPNGTFVPSVRMIFVP